MARRYLVVAPHAPTALLAFSRHLSEHGFSFPEGSSVAVIAPAHHVVPPRPVVAGWLLGCSEPLDKPLAASLEAHGYASLDCSQQAVHEHALAQAVELAVRLGAARVTPILLPPWDCRAAARLAEALAARSTLITMDMSHCRPCGEAEREDMELLSQALGGAGEAVCRRAALSGFTGDCTACLALLSGLASAGRCRRLLGPVGGCVGRPPCRVSWLGLVMECEA